MTGSVDAIILELNDFGQVHFGSRFSAFASACRAENGEKEDKEDDEENEKDAGEEDG